MVFEPSGIRDGHQIPIGTPDLDPQRAYVGICRLSPQLSATRPLRPETYARHELLSALVEGAAAAFIFSVH